MERRQTIAVQIFGLPAVTEGVAGAAIDVLAGPYENGTLASLLCNAD